MPLPRDSVERVYREIQTAQRGLAVRAPGLPGLFEQLYGECVGVLANAARRPLVSMVPGKTYFSFEANGRISRPINGDLYGDARAGWAALVTALANDDFTGLTEEAITETLYSVAFSFLAVIDLTRSGDQKTPGTYFEYLIAHLFASRLGVDPVNWLPVLNLDMNTLLPTDYVFDLGAGLPKFHLPVKTSTRERVIQVWAHQRVLDQWWIYQMHIAQLKRVYYLDVPAAYDALNNVFPPLSVVPFGRFFLEVAELSAP